MAQGKSKSTLAREMQDFLEEWRLFQLHLPLDSDEGKLAHSQLQL